MSVGTRKPVKQRNGSDCVIAAVANAVDVTYKEVRARFGGSVRGGLEYHEARWLLSEYGTWRETKPRNPRPIVEWVKRHPRGRYVLCLQSGFLGIGDHAVACVDGVLMGHYSEDWPVVAYFRKEEEE